MLQTEGDELRDPGITAHRDRAGESGIVAAIAGRLYFDCLIPLALLIGICLRTREWLFDKSLWLDELMVTYSITRRSFVGLVAPLNFNQAGPVGWLWAERASIDLFGHNDLALRFPEWLASIIALGLFPLVARRIVGRWAAPAATLIFATSQELSYYASETKQYAFDVTCALLALLVTIRLVQRRPALRQALLWGLSCAGLVWCSQPAILICAVCGLVLLLRWCRDRKTLLTVLLGGLILGASIALDWVVTLRHQSANVNLLSFWRTFGGYPPLKQTFSADRHWLAAAVTTTLKFLGIGHPVVALCLMACGLIVVILWRGGIQGLLLALPLAVGVGMAVTDHYPFARRLALYLYPIVVMLLTAPLAISEGERHPIARRWRAAAVVASAAALITVAAPGVALGIGEGLHPDQSATGRQSIAFVSQHQRPGDLVLAQTGAPSILLENFYGPHYHVREGGLFYLGLGWHGKCADPFRKLHHVTRVWLVFAELSAGQPLNRNQIVVSRMAVNGRLVLSYTGVDGAGAYLFDLYPPRPKEPDPAGLRNCFSIQPPWNGQD
jgi:4-amino-4-deoxy-L-arabinose transferase-like glycosyltransferase